MLHSANYENSVMSESFSLTSFLDTAFSEPDIKKRAILTDGSFDIL